MTVSLHEIVNSFLADKAYLDEQHTIAAKRQETQPYFNPDPAIVLLDITNT